MIATGSKAFLVFALFAVGNGWVGTFHVGSSHGSNRRSSCCSTRSGTTSSSSLPSSSWFKSNDIAKAAAATMTSGGTKLVSPEQGKAILLQLGAVLDRGQAYNPTSGPYYQERMDYARTMIERFVTNQAAAAAVTGDTFVPTSLDGIAGEWELVLTTVNHGIFRSSPFFLAIQESYETYAEEKEAFSMSKADLFFKLHELQTCSWGVSKIGRVAQHITPNGGSSTQGMLYSEFDTSIFSLSVIPLLGFWKLLPTFGGCVVTAASCVLREQGLLEMKVEYTTARKVPGLQGLPLIGDILWKIKVPVGTIWKLLPWNKGRDAECRVYVRYVDDDFRIVQDISGDYFVYVRPVLPRALDLALSGEVSA